jgi:arsenate reductase-like glutaredoxin family protein
VKAREFLARKTGDDGFTLRNLIKEPLTADELRKLAALAGGPKELVAPKRRAEAEGLDGEKLIAWLAADAGRVRRPIVVTGRKLTLGFNAAAQEQLEENLK